MARSSSKGARILIGILAVIAVIPLAFLYRTLTCTLYYFPPEDAPKVLWIGNSHTFVHDVPARVQLIGEKQGIPLDIEAVVWSNMRLRGHLDWWYARRRVQAEDWDVVVLQAQSSEAIFEREEVRKAIIEFRAMIPPETRLVLYENWVYHLSKVGPEFWKNSDEPSPQEMQEQTNHSVQLSAAQNNAVVAPVGPGIVATYDGDPDLELVQPDGNHLTAIGASFSSMMLYSAITGQEVPPASVAWSGDAEELAALDALAEEAELVMSEVVVPGELPSDVPITIPDVPAQVTVLPQRQHVFYTWVTSERVAFDDAEEELHASGYETRRRVVNKGMNSEGSYLDGKKGSETVSIFFSASHARALAWVEWLHVRPDPLRGHPAVAPAPNP